LNCNLYVNISSIHPWTHIEWLNRTYCWMSTKKIQCARYGVKSSASQMITAMKNTDYTDEFDLPMKKLPLILFLSLPSSHYFRYFQHLATLDIFDEIYDETFPRFIRDLSVGSKF